MKDLKDLYYTIEGNGYHIYDRNDDKFHIYQYEPYTQLFVPNGTLEENAQAQIADLMVEPESTVSPDYVAGYDQALIDLLGGEQ